MSLKHLSEAEFDELVLKAAGPVLVDFFAEWCGPCRMLSPVLEAFAEEHQDKVSVYKLNVDEVGIVAAQYGVVSIPTMLLFKNGEVVKKMVGFHRKDEIEALL